MSQEELTHTRRLLQKARTSGDMRAAQRHAREVVRIQIQLEDAGPTDPTIAKIHLLQIELDHIEDIAKDSPEEGAVRLAEWFERHRITERRVG